MDVTINELDSQAYETILENCDSNGFSVTNSPSVSGQKCDSSVAGLQCHDESAQVSVKSEDRSMATNAIENIAAEDADTEQLSTGVAGVSSTCSRTDQLSGDDKSGGSSKPIEVVHGDANVIMHSRQFNFM